MATIFENQVKRFESRSHTEMSLLEYLELCKTDKMAYASAAERMLTAIGEPKTVQTRNDPRLSRIWMNKEIKVYDSFYDFYGLEGVIENIVNFYKHAAQGLEERKQILYLLGPVGSAKSSLAERLKKIFEKVPFYVLKAGDQISPVFESPLGLFDPDEDGNVLESEYGIPKRYCEVIPSPWAAKRLVEFGGDLTKFSVVKVYPSKLLQAGVTKTEPGDENNQDISALVGKVNVRKLDDLDENDPDAYKFSGGLNITTQGLLEFVEMFKAPIKMLHPLLTATQEGNYNGTAGFGAIPYQGTIIAHCFSEDTELLTKHGWKGIDELNEGDIISTLNRETGLMEYQPAINKFVYDNYVGDMYHMSSSCADHLVTSNHKMIYESYGSYKECLAEDFFVKGAKLPVSAKLNNENNIDYYNSINELRFHVWCITDGSIHYTQKNGNLNYRFHLKKDRKKERLFNLVKDLGYELNISEEDDNGTIHFYVKNLDPKFNKFLSKDVHRFLNYEQTMALLQEWKHTDGSASEANPDTGMQLYTNVKDHADIIQELCTIYGHKSTCTPCKKDGYADVYSLHVKMNATHIRSDDINKGIVNYSGRVWCVETENHTLVAKRNGKILITGNSNESEWQTFRNNKNNEAFLDRVYIVKVPYCLRKTEEYQIYKKLIDNSDLKDAPCAPGTLEMMAQFSILSRLKVPENSSLYSKMRVYDGEALKDEDPNAKSVQEYRDDAGVNEGMTGSSTRFAYKVLSKTFNYDPQEISASPVHLMLNLEHAIKQENMNDETEQTYISFIKDILAPKYAEFLGDEIQKAYLESYSEYGQNLFDKYVLYADAYIEDQDFRDPDTGQMYSKQELNEELEKIEKPAGIANPKDFRHEIVNYVLRARANNGGNNPKWTSYEKLRSVIEKKMFANTEDLLPVISFGKKATEEEQQKHKDFVSRMKEKGYTERMVRLLVEWYMRYNKSN